MSLSQKVFSKLELPKNFYTNIILLENAYYLHPSQEKIGELLSLYQKGIEYYSSISNQEKANDLSNKIKIFLTSTQTMKVVKELNKRIEKNNTINRSRTTLSLLEVESNENNDKDKESAKNIVLLFIKNHKKSDIKQSISIRKQKEMLIKRIKEKKIRIMIKSNISLRSSIKRGTVGYNNHTNNKSLILSKSKYLRKASHDCYENELIDQINTEESEKKCINNHKIEMLNHSIEQFVNKVLFHFKSKLQNEINNDIKLILNENYNERIKSYDELQTNLKEFAAFADYNNVNNELLTDYKKENEQRVNQTMSIIGNKIQTYSSENCCDDVSITLASDELIEKINALDSKMKLKE